jgi:anthranilate phosphoribosyltransferase
VHRYIKAVGAGQKRARDLTREEACAAMGLIADGQARPEQIGAFLLALRMKGEAGAELAGFVDALAARSEVGGARAPAGTLDVDCHGDGHHGRATLLPAAACALAALGVPTLLRLQVDQPHQRHGLVESLAALGLDVGAALDGPRAARALASIGVAAIDLPRYCPSLATLVALRPLFGVRTVAQTLMKLLDPLAASARVVGVFHAPYLPSTAAALAERAGTSLCVQALGGLPEAAPGKMVRVCRPGGTPETIDLRALGDARAATAMGAAAADAAPAAMGAAAADAAPAAMGATLAMARATAMRAASLDATLATARAAAMGAASASAAPVASAPVVAGGASAAGARSAQPRHSADGPRSVEPSRSAGGARSARSAANEDDGVAPGPIANGAIDGPRENAAALDGEPGPALRAAAVAALWLYVARGIPPLVAAEQALATLRDGRARAIAARLRDV